MDKLTQTKIVVMDVNPFYHTFLTMCQVYFNKDIPTACVKLKRSGNVVMEFNEEFYDSLPEIHKTGVMIHEILHLTHYHLIRGQDFPKGVQKFLNVIYDLVINQYIPKAMLPDSAVTLEGMMKQTGKDLLPFKSAEYYFNELLEQCETVEQMTTLDDHGSFSVECSEKLAESVIKDITYKAAMKNYGSLSKELKDLVDRLLAPEKINWKQVLRKFVGKNLSKNHENSKTRANRRLGLLAPGQKKTYSPKILVALDESGSVDDKSISMFMNELSSILHGCNDKIDVVAFDTETKYLGSMDSARQIKAERVLSGGTSFVPIFEDAKKYKSDMVIIFTDGYGEMPKELPKKPILWILNHKESVELPGVVLHVEDVK